MAKSQILKERGVSSLSRSPGVCWQQTTHCFFTPKPPSSCHRHTASSRISSHSLAGSKEPSNTTLTASTSGCNAFQVPLVLLAQRLGAWLVLPSPSHLLIRTIRFGYVIQFARCPPRLSNVLVTLSDKQRCSCPVCGVCSPASQASIQDVDAEMYSHLRSPQRLVFSDRSVLPLILSLSPCVCRGCPCPSKGSAFLTRLSRLAYSSSLSRFVVQTLGSGA